MLRWVKIKDDSWDAFYAFLEDLSETARKILGYQDTLKAIGMQTSDFKFNNDKKPCSTCGKKHAGACNIKEKVVAAGGLHKNNQQA